MAWSKTAELMEQWLHKGSPIGVEGRIQTRNYDNQQGQRVYITEVVVQNVTFLEPKNGSTAQNGQEGINTPQAQYQSYTSAKQGYTTAKYDDGEELNIASDDLPF